jgi:hypothetical protein
LSSMTTMLEYPDIRHGRWGLQSTAQVLSSNARTHPHIVNKLHISRAIQTFNLPPTMLHLSLFIVFVDLLSGLLIFS